MKLSIKDDLARMVVQLWKLGAKSQYSPKKTDYMHETFGKLLLLRAEQLNLPINDRLEYQTKFEYKLAGKRSIKSVKKNWQVPCFWGETFSLDAVLVNKQDNNIIHPYHVDRFESDIHNSIDTIYLFKAQLTGYNQNRFNSANNLVGEIQRIFSHRANRNKRVCFINIVPKATVANNSQKERTYTAVRPLCLSKKDSPGIPLQELEISPWIKDQIDEINIYYDLDFGGDFKSQCADWDSLVEKQNNFVTIDSDSITVMDNYISKLSQRLSHK
jgi:hypothetical protein